MITAIPGQKTDYVNCASSRDSSFVKKKTTNKSALYYNQPKHAPVRLVVAYGFFVSILTLIIVGISFLFSADSNRSKDPESTRINDHKSDQAKLDGSSLSSPDAIDSASRSSANLGEETDSKNRSITDEKRNGTASVNPLTANDVAQSVSLQPWFYDKIGEGPAISGTNVTDRNDKFTLLIKTTPRLKDAQKLQQSLVKQGIHAFIQKQPIAGKKIAYRIQFGVFRSKRRATEERNRLSRDFSIDSSISRLEL
jgi:hypothetical protein